MIQVIWYACIATLSFRHSPNFGTFRIQQWLLRGMTVGVGWCWTEIHLRGPTRLLAGNRGWYKLYCSIDLLSRDPLALYTYICIWIASARFTTGTVYPKTLTKRVGKGKRRCILIHSYPRVVLVLSCCLLVIATLSTKLLQQSNRKKNNESLYR